MSTDPASRPAALRTTDRLAEVYDLIGPLYRRAQRRVEMDVPNEGLSVGVRAVLNMLRQGGAMTVPQMGRAQAISRQFVQRMVNEAATRGLVEAVPNPAHRKSSLIRLTTRGLATIDAVIARERHALSEIGDDLSDADIDACLRVLSRMLAMLDGVDVE